jgi:hypothetical protein
VELVLSSWVCSWLWGGFMLALVAATASAESRLQNTVSLTDDLANGEAKTYKLLLDVDVR